MQVESSATPLLTVDEVEKVQRQRVASLIGHVFQLTYAATVDKLIHVICLIVAKSAGFLAAKKG